MSTVQLKFAGRARLVLAMFVFLMIYDGAIRKWLFSSFEQIIFIGKDVLLVFTLFILVIVRSRLPKMAMPKGTRLFFILYSAWVLLEVGNFNLPNLYIGLWGLKSHLLYASLIILLPLAFSRTEELFQVLIKSYPWIVIPVCTLAFAQLAAPADSFINQQLSGGMEGVSYFGEAGLVRVTGTFSYLSGMASFVQTSILLGFGLYITGARSKLFLVGLAFAAAALPATGSRSVIVIVTVGAALILLFAQFARLISVKSALRYLFVLVALGFISVQTQDDAWTAFAQRAEGARHDESRVFTSFTNAFDFMETSGAIGFGTGSANLGARAFEKTGSDFYWLPIGSQFEEESGRIVLELGWIGWALSLFMRVSILFWSVKLSMKGVSRSVRAVAVIAMPIVALGAYQGNGVFGVPLSSAYYWFCVAMLCMAEYEDRRLLSDRRLAISKNASTELR